MKKLFIDSNEKLCIPDNESMLLVGKCGTGKTRTIKYILKQLVSNEKVNVVYLDRHKNDYNDVKEICGNLLNKTNVLKEEELESLLTALQKQCQLRRMAISYLNLSSIEKQAGQHVITYYIDGVEYMPDDIVQYNSQDGSQKFAIAKEYYENINANSKSSISYECYNVYEPTKTIVCIDEFYPNDMSDVINGMLYNTALDLVRFGKTTLQNFMFHNSADNSADYEILFGKKGNESYYHGDVTVQLEDKLLELKAS